MPRWKSRDVSVGLRVQYERCWLLHRRWHAYCGFQLSWNVDIFPPFSGDRVKLPGRTVPPDVEMRSLEGSHMGALSDLETILKSASCDSFDYDSCRGL